MELEKIRQSDCEVRWQHEEDVSECNSCKKTFQNRKEKVSLIIPFCLLCSPVFKLLEINTQNIFVTK